MKQESALPKRLNRKAFFDARVIVAAVTAFKLRRATNHQGSTPPDGILDDDWSFAKKLSAGAGIQEAPIDYAAQRSYVEHLQRIGVKLMLIAGTTGEASTLNVEEQKNLTRETIMHALGSRVIAGTGSNDTSTALDLVSAAMRGGAAAVILKPPYYNHPELPGVYEHWRRIMKTGVPAVLYDVPARTAQALDLAMILRLAEEFPNFLGVKVEGSIERYRKVRDQAPSDFSIFATDGNAPKGFNTGICNGIVTVVGNLVYDDIENFVNTESPTERERIANRLNPLYKAINREVSPQGIKYALEAAGILPKAVYRLPLTSPERQNQAIINRELAALDLIKQPQAANA